MKTISTLLSTIVILLFISYAGFAQQNRWTYVANDVRGAQFFIDQNSIENFGKNLRIWHKTVYKDKTYRISLLEWACYEKKFLIIEDSTFDSEGSPIKRENGSGWLFVVPESINEGLYKFVCSLPTGNSNRISANGISKLMAQIIVKTANVRDEPDTKGNIIRKAKLGEKFMLVGESETKDWYQIIISRTKTTAWIHGNNIKLIEITDRKKTKKRKS